VLVDYNALRQIVLLTIEHASRNVDLAGLEIEGLPAVLVRACIATLAGTD
jgi:hypothetical protein